MASTEECFVHNLQKIAKQLQISPICKMIFFSACKSKNLSPQSTEDNEMTSKTSKMNNDPFQYILIQARPAA